jgi:hypothetical protein
MTAERYYGKYAGVVRQNIDPEGRGRILVEVPDVLGQGISSWAMPSLPFAGLQMGMYIIPPPQAGVWVEFEKGDPDYPIWTGCWWGSRAEVPVTAQTATPGMPIVSLETALKSAIVVSDTPVPPFLPTGGILLTAGSSYVRIDKTGITIFGPTIRVNGATLVDVNGGALTVLGPAPAV